MKKIFAVLLSLLIIIGASSCSPNTKTASKKTGNSTVKKMEKVLKDMNYTGIVSVTKNGKPFFQKATGKDEKGNNLKVNSTMYLGSVSKQFCAAAILILRDKGKLSLNDKVKKYFPKYKTGKKITLKNLLTMRSGIPDMVNEASIEELNPENSEKKNTAIIKNWIYKQPLKFKPDSEYAYSNSNFFLLSNIVEQVSGKHYIKFIRENIFEPLGMKNSGFVDEVKDNMSWAKGFNSDGDNVGNAVKGLTKGAGDIASNAEDMEKWMTGLSSGKIISEKSYKEMTSVHSKESGSKYGYGIEQQAGGGIGHSGRIGNYYAKDYINKKGGYNIFIVTRKFAYQYEALIAKLSKYMK